MRTAAGVLLGVVAATLWYLQTNATPRIGKPIPWAGAGEWLAAETHVHSRFSDGRYTVDELVDASVGNGCDVLAITDHTDGGLKAATPEYHAAIAAARARVPQLTLLTGIEWNVPPGKGQDHAVVLFPPGMDDAALLGEFKERFDDFDKAGENPELAVAAFAWLRTHATNAPEAPVMFLNHPGRRATDIAAVRTQLEWLSGIGRGVFAGMEGAPGHQNARPLGAYGRALQPEDRWDPAVAAPGAAWDQLLARGTDLSGALASSDFHGPKNGDYWPCEFSATWIYAPDRTPAGVLRALRAGTFVGVHGGIAERVQLRVAVPGLERAAIPGEAIRGGAGTEVSIELEADVPDVDWAGKPNRIDVVEIIRVTADAAEVIHTAPLDANGRLAVSHTVPRGGAIFRARGRRIVEDGPDLLFYTNAIAVR